MSDSSPPTSVAIIGAGISGLSCARTLTDSGYRVTVFEKSRGPGGRMSTRRTELPHPASEMPSETLAKWQCDHGAQYFTARNPLFVAQVQQWEKAGVVAQWNPVIKTFGPRPDRLESERVPNHRYVGVPRMTAPARQLAKGIEVVTSTRIIAISRTNAGWVLHQEVEQAVVGPFTCLVMAIPAQQAKELLTLISGDISSGVQIVEILAACHKHALSPCWALMLHYLPSHPVAYDSAPDFDAAFVNSPADNDSIVSWIARDTSKPGRHHSAGDTWLVHASPKWSQQNLELDEQQVFQTLLAEFRNLTGIQSIPAAYGLHRWRFAQSGVSGGSLGHLWQDNAGLGLCGDWLSGGRVEGAWLSGYELAKCISARFPDNN